MAATVELEPTFVRALRLLHSKARDSAEQLRLMVEESLRASNPRDLKRSDSVVGRGSLSQPVSDKKSIKFLQEISAPNVTVIGKKSSKDDDNKKREAEKRSYDKIAQDKPVETPVEVKKFKIEGLKISPTSSPPTGRLDIDQDKDGEVANESTDAGDLALEMGLLCIVCRNMGISSGNQLVECQECHNLYHQECHKPPITDQDVNDPRLAWYCAKCAKNIKKLAIKNQKPSKTGPPVLPKESIIVSKPSKVETLSSTPRLFKRPEVKLPPNNSSNSSSSSSSSNKPTGLAGLAASLSGRNNLGKSSQSGNGSKSSSSTKSSTTPPSTGKPSMSSLSSSSTSSKSTSSSLLTKQSSSASTSSTSRSSSSSSASTSSSKSSSSNSNNGNSSSSSSSSKSSNVMISADKRLQIMKKKAEKKMQEKRWK